MSTFYEHRFGVRQIDKAFLENYAREIAAREYDVREFDIWLICRTLSYSHINELATPYLLDGNYKNRPIPLLLCARAVAQKARSNFDQNLDHLTLAKTSAVDFLHFLRLAPPQCNALGYVSLELMQTPGNEKIGASIVQEGWEPTTAGTRAFERAALINGQGKKPVEVYGRLAKENPAAHLLFGLYTDFQSANCLTGVFDLLKQEGSLAQAVKKYTETARLDGSRPIVISSMPKSGTVFLANHLSQIFNFPRARLSVNDHVVESFVETFAKLGGIVVDHFYPSEDLLDALTRHGIDKITVHLRDPRQAAVSGFHFRESDGLRGDVFSFKGISPIFFKTYPKLTHKEKRAWFVKNEFPWCAKFALDWWKLSKSPENRIQINFTSQEMLKKDPQALFQNLMEFHEQPIENTKHIKIEGAIEGKLHFRKGLSDEWRSLFSEEQKKTFWNTLNQAPDMCERFGWTP